MTTQTQGKGKKKNKEVVKVSLDEFNQIDAPHGHSVVSLKMTGLDWAATMADHEQSSETQQIIVPTAPRAQRGPAVDFDSLPSEGPFRVSLFNVPMSVEEKEITDRFLQNIEVIRVETSKSSTTVELKTRNDLYEALCKDGSNLKNRQISVCLFGEAPRDNYGSDRYGSRGGNSSYGDRYGDRNQGGFGGQRSGDRYGDRSSGFGRDRDNYSGFSRGGFEQRGGYGDRYNDRGNFRDRGQYTSGGGEPESEEPTNWRARPNIKPPPPSTPSTYNNGSRQPYIESRSEPAPNYHNQPASHAPSQQRYQPEPYYQPRQQQHNYQQSNNTPFHSQYNDNASSNNRPMISSSEERPKLVLSKRKGPLNLDTNSATRNEAIFGKAVPSSTPYQKMNEVEEKLKAVQITDRKEIKSTSQAESQVGSQPGSAPRSRRVSSTHSESNS